VLLLYAVGFLLQLHWNLRKQEEQRVAVRPGNGHFISVGQVSSDAATLQRGGSGGGAAAFAAAFAAAAN